MFSSNIEWFTGELEGTSRIDDSARVDNISSIERNLRSKGICCENLPTKEFSDYLSRGSGKTISFSEGDGGAF